MVNLLTVFEKKKILKEYRIRLSIVSLFVVSILISVAIIFLIPSYFLSSVKYDVIKNQLKLEKEKIATISEGKDPIKITKDINNKLSILKEVKSSLPDPYTATTIVIDHKPAGIYINAILYDKSKIQEKITISGISENRETLISFLKSMKSENRFSKVELPISSFVKGENINFSMLVTIEETVKNKNEKK